MNVPSNNTELINFLVKQRPKIMKALASKFEHTLNKEDIEDVFSESCKRVWEKLMPIENNYLEDLASRSGNLESFFFGICNNTAMNMIRKRQMTVPKSKHKDENGKIVVDKTAREVSMDSMIQEDTDGSVNMDKLSYLMSAATNGHEGEIELSKMEEAVKEIITQLPDNCNKIFHGIYWDDMENLTAVAEKYHFSNANSVKTTKSRCVKKFKDKLESLFPEVFKILKK